MGPVGVKAEREGAGKSEKAHPLRAVLRAGPAPEASGGH